MTFPIRKNESSAANDITQLSLATNEQFDIRPEVVHICFRRRRCRDAIAQSITA